MCNTVTCDPCADSHPFSGTRIKGGIRRDHTKKKERSHKEITKYHNHYFITKKDKIFEKNLSAMNSFQLVESGRPYLKPTTHFVWILSYRIVECPITTTDYQPISRLFKLKSQSASGKRRRINQTQLPVEQICQLNSFRWASSDPALRRLESITKLKVSPYCSSQLI